MRSTSIKQNYCINNRFFSAGIYRWIVLALLWILVSSSSNAQVLSKANSGQLYDRLAATIHTAPNNAHTHVDLSDFQAKAQAGLNFMLAGSRIEHIESSSVVLISSDVSKALDAYMQALYLDDADQEQERIITDTRRSWEGKRIGALSWNVVTPDSTIAVQSIAIFDTNGDVLFDTELVNFYVSSESVETAQPDNKESVRPLTISASRNGIESEDTATLQKSLVLTGIFGSSVKLNYKASVRAVVAPYITPATNDAAFSLETTEIRLSKSDKKGLHPIDDPVLFFGSDGRVRDIYGQAIPHKSKISLGTITDHFWSGEYTVSAFDGRNKNWNLAIGASVSTGSASVGISFSPVSLSPFSLISNPGVINEFFIGDRVYYEALPGARYRGIFWNSGSLALRNVIIRAGEGTGETGSVSVRIPMVIGHLALGVLQFPSQTVSSLSLNVEYVRGNNIQAPSMIMESDTYETVIGQEVVVSVHVKNESNKVDISEGQVKIDVGTLGGTLIPKSPTTQDVGVIETNGSKTFTFVFEAMATGEITPQAELNASWGFPVPAEVSIQQSVGINNNINVGLNVSNETDLDPLPNELILEQNFPNPFSTSTTIQIQLPKTSHVAVKIYNTLGKEVRQLINTNLNVGHHRMVWDGTDNYGNKVSSGLYMYQLRTDSHTLARTMSILR